MFEPINVDGSFKTSGDSDVSTDYTLAINFDGCTDDMLRGYIARCARVNMCTRFRKSPGDYNFDEPVHVSMADVIRPVRVSAPRVTSESVLADLNRMLADGEKTMDEVMQMIRDAS